uniref:RAP domain-containing protein n=1 Tax=Chromera velia CCMP2878 TaxID=1169474 RepID=A0A0G4HEM0_9ALVE|eukprot:Cvel_6561.t1-p1 / transcript=Cvel_6561.t1 / gene=Cvel_6561 / organism=Chromera_velia_CCMP2878 / gene_product=hypothetical protein / transcript_product=hypothetical protein / location=Cvel_scaffold323:52548-64753(+) / protein_length=1174 / sequence_SO=supercontig / SO=protein_coding / is_pseudo=false
MTALLTPANALGRGGFGRSVCAFRMPSIPVGSLHSEHVHSASPSSFQPIWGLPRGGEGFRSVRGDGDGDGGGDGRDGENFGKGIQTHRPALRDVSVLGEHRGTFSEEELNNNSGGRKSRLSELATALVVRLVKASRGGVRDASLWQDLSRRTVFLGPHLEPADLPVVLNCFAKIRYRDARVFRALSEPIQRHAGIFSPKGLAVLLNAYRRLEVKSAGTIEFLLLQVCRCINAFGGEDLALSMNAVSFFAFFHGEFWRGSVRHVPRVASEMTHLHVALCVNALSRLDMRNRDALLALAKTAWRLRSEFTQETLSTTVMGFAKLDFNHSGLTRALNFSVERKLNAALTLNDVSAQVAGRRGDVFDVQALCCLSFTLVCLTDCSPQIADKLLSLLAPHAHAIPDVFVRLLKYTEQTIRLVRTDIGNKLSDKSKGVLTEARSREISFVDRGSRWAYEVAWVLQRMGVQAERRVYADAICLDIFFPKKRAVITCCGPHSYYVDSTERTAYSKMKQRLLEAQGYHVSVLAYYEWNELKLPEDKERFLWSLGRRAAREMAESGGPFGFATSEEEAERDRRGRRHRGRERERERGGGQEMSSRWQGENTEEAEGAEDECGERERGSAPSYEAALDTFEAESDLVALEWRGRGSKVKGEGDSREGVSEDGVPMMMEMQRWRKGRRGSLRKRTSVHSGQEPSDFSASSDDKLSSLLSEEDAFALGASSPLPERREVQEEEGDRGTSQSSDLRDGFRVKAKASGGVSALQLSALEGWEEEDKGDVGWGESEFLSEPRAAVGGRVEGEGGIVHRTTWGDSEGGKIYQQKKEQQEGGLVMARPRGPFFVDDDDEERERQIQIEKGAGTAREVRKGLPDTPPSSSEWQPMEQVNPSQWLDEDEGDREHETERDSEEDGHQGTTSGLPPHWRRKRGRTVSFSHRDGWRSGPVGEIRHTGLQEVQQGGHVEGSFDGLPQYEVLEGSSSASSWTSPNPKTQSSDSPLLLHESERKRNHFFEEREEEEREGTQRGDSPFEHEVIQTSESAQRALSGLSSSQPAFVGVSAQSSKKSHRARRVTENESAKTPTERDPFPERISLEEEDFDAWGGQRREGDLDSSGHSRRRNFKQKNGNTKWPQPDPPHHHFVPPVGGHQEDHVKRWRGSGKKREKQQKFKIVFDGTKFLKEPAE